MTSATKRTRAQVAEAIRLSGGLKNLTAARLKISRRTLYDYFQRWPDLREVLDEAEAELGDIAEMKLFQAIEAGDGACVRFYLETKCKGRGYTRRVETVGKDGGPIETTASERSDALRSISTDDLKALVAVARKAQEANPHPTLKKEPRR
jgi:hypothetical protein